MGNIMSNRTSRKQGSIISNNGEKNNRISSKTVNSINNVDNDYTHNAMSSLSTMSNSENDMNESSESVESGLVHISERGDQKLMGNNNSVLFTQNSQGKVCPFEGGFRPKRYNSCSTLFVDVTVSSPDLDVTLRCVAVAIHGNIVDGHMHEEPEFHDMYNEYLHPLSSVDIIDDVVPPSDEAIYRFIKSLFQAASLTAECAIIALVYVERLISLNHFTLHASNWKRVVLGAVLLASKVWDDQAVWNVDFCTILPDIPVPDMNDLERTFLEHLQFNVSVETSQYTKYYFELRQLAEKRNAVWGLSPLDIVGAAKLEALNAPKGGLNDPDGHDPKDSVKRSKSVDEYLCTYAKAIIS